MIGGPFSRQALSVIAADGRLGRAAQVGVLLRQSGLAQPAVYLCQQGVDLQVNDTALLLAAGRLFGVGQFQNKQDAKGAFFAATEGVMLISSVSIWLYLVNTYGIRSTRVGPDDASSVLRLQQTEIGTGFAFLGLWVLGAVDSYLNYKPQTRAEIDDSLLPIELRDLDKPAPKKKLPPKTSFHVLPMFVPNGAGIGLAWEN